MSELESGTFRLLLTTVTGNSAGTRGGSLAIASPSTTDKVQLDHAIQANGAPQDFGGFDASPANLTATDSLIEWPGNTDGAGAHDLTGIDPLLGPLAGNGVPTLTDAPLLGSPGLDAGPRTLRAGRAAP